jgi:hypothetical protein
MVGNDALMPLSQSRQEKPDIPGRLHYLHSVYTQCIVIKDC